MDWNCNYIYKSPIFVSEDLRDGNQSLISGYTIKEKIIIWEYLISIGIKNIVLGFPSSNKHDFNFIKYLIKNNIIKSDINISVLTPAKKNLIDITFEIIKKTKNSTIHLYNSISKIQRKIVFKKCKLSIIKFTIEFIKYVIKKIKNININFFFQYSPESFSDSELFFSKKICYLFSYLSYLNKIKSILNLPTSIDKILINKYINSINYIKKKLFNTILSVHLHNDMNFAVSGSHLAILAGANRIEGTLLGDGERSGNASIITMSTNYYNLGINSKIKHNNSIFKIKKYFKDRKNWLINLNYVAFSGSHQDAITKSYFLRKKFNWNVIYVNINPKIYNFNHKNLIKINSQSGRGGVKFIFLYNYKLNFNKIILNKIYNLIQDISEQILTEIYKELILSLLICRSNIIKLYKIKILNFYFSIVYNFIFYIFILKFNKKKIIKVISIVYE